MSRFFIDRPIFAWVIAIVITLAGTLAVFNLAVEQYPNIAPPTISIRATYTGASAQTVENSVTQVIEQQMSGLDNLMYMSASSNAAGSAQVQLTFKAGTDPDVAQMQVQNKLQQAEAMLPDVVKSTGLTVSKSVGGSFFEVLAFTSDDGRLSGTDIADFMVSTLQDPISRVTGVGRVQVMGSQYSMRVWLDPEKLRTYSLMPSDVTAAITAQNADVSSGQLGALPATQGQALNATISSRSRLQTPEQFKAIVVKSDSDGAVVRLSDVARVELGSEDYAMTSTFNGKPAAGIGIELASGANAMQVSEAVEARLQELQSYFPEGISYHVASSTTPFVKISIEEVVKTLVEAVVLVLAIMYLFLQNWRVTLIPAIAVPVVLMGTFGVLALLGYSINTLTMFGMVLAIGLLVDDAIVVVENVERVMREEGLPPREATRKSMGQITGALVGIALVLTAVFLPMAFFSGSTGVIYRQFSVTIASAMILSVLVAMTLTPALCATLLTPGQVTRRGPLGRFFAGFNTRFDQGAERYQRGVARVVGHRRAGVAVYLVLLVVLGLQFWQLPTSFLPEEDQGTLMVQLKMPPGATKEKTQQVISEVSDYVRGQPEVETVMAVAGFSQGTSGQNAGMAFIRLKNWSEREASATDIGVRISEAMLGRFPDAQIYAFAPSGIPGLGQATGFTLELQDFAGAGHEALVDARQKLLALAAQEPSLSAVRYANLEDAPTFDIKIDDAKAGALKLTQSDINATLSTAFGATYVNDFVDRGRIKKVYVQGQEQARMLPQDVYRWTVRNSDDAMVPFSAFASSGWSYAPASLARFNGIAAMEISGQPAQGVSSGTAMAEIVRLVQQLPGGFGYAWSGLSFQEQQAGAQAPLLYAVSLLFVFLCLAALYESWSIPFSVMLAVPIGVGGALLLTSLRGLSNDVYFQVGLLATVGLAAKNGILIVEFAKELEERGKPLVEAVLEAARLRLRPILMTSMAFLLGVLPLMVSSGAGSAGRHSLGTGVFGGTLASTVLGIFFVPLFYVIVRSLFPGRKSQPAAPTEVNE
ncbi:hydrophobe/amphiphile efflux-1 family RND transporter [Pseudomonas daroniae]|uniref:Efflux pump membrane transporter n=1 Tax=Phytopseudomonas daroniae TaxID=2487519 RepID=A0A4Q9QK62_9GAMM|nr:MULTISPECIES: efflux RND transporter permease subunit [Pseudomonas]TBU77965.1 hydrophobe/amphiphile efflux-1 family RND transporter [Pseudomonas daroniae]TBU82313.1 hydrophobe/amphiphile efflux-1 family RND transporter [Pseudomonas sp. FRB 228]TBU91060.1 hydrophobe/amphiphile efflux-1 family RND transporter [Pseudomonas daroniae]